MTDTKIFERGKSYRIGRRQPRSSTARIVWAKKPTAKVIQGDYIVDTLKINTPSDWWAKNPLDMDVNQTFIIAEIDPQNGDDQYFSEGLYLTPRDKKDQTLADVPLLMGESNSTDVKLMMHQIEKSRQQHVEDLKRELDRSAAQNATLIEQLNDLRKQYDQEHRESQKTINALEKQVAELTHDLKVQKEVNQIIGQQSKEEPEGPGLSDVLGTVLSHPATGPVLERVLGSIVDRFVGAGHNSIQKSTKPPQPPPAGASAADLFDLPPVGPEQ